MRAGIRWGMSSIDAAQELWRLLIPLREQARSHKGMHFKCGSGLAREESGSNTTNPESSPHPRLQAQMRPLPRRQA